MVSVQNQRVYRWYIVAAGLCLMAFSLGIISNCFALFTIPVTKSLGFTRKAFGVNQTLMFATTMIMTPQTGKVIQKIGLVREIRIATIVIAMVYSGYAMSSELWQFYGVSILLGALMPFVTTVPLSILIGQWFHHDLGIALGITFMGSGVGGMLFNPIASALIQNYGWRFAYGLVAGLMLLVLVPITFLIIREAPKELQNNSGKARTQTEDGLTGKSFSMTAKTMRYRVYMLMGLLVGAGTYAVINFTSTYLQDMGYTAYFAATVAAASMGGMAVGKPVLGCLYDRFGIRRTTLLAVIFLALGMLGSSLISWKGAILMIVLGTAVGCPLGTISYPLLIGHVFGTRDYSEKLGLMVAFGNLGAAVTPTVAGVIYEHTGSYRPMYQLLLLLMIMCYFIFSWILPKREEPHS